MQHQRYQPKSSLFRKPFEEGREEGREQGREEGRQEALEQALSVARAAVRRALAERAVPLTDEDDARLSACDDLGVLIKWATNAATATGSADVFDD